MPIVYDYEKSRVGFCVNCRDKILELLKESTVIPRLVVGKQGKGCDLLLDHGHNIVQRCELLLRMIPGDCRFLNGHLKLTNDARRALIKAIN